MAVQTHRARSSRRARFSPGEILVVAIALMCIGGGVSLGAVYLHETSADYRQAHTHSRGFVIVPAILTGVATSAPGSVAA